MSKKRNRRRKSKYARPLLSFAHGLAFVIIGFGLAFLLALLRATQLEDQQAMGDPQGLSELNLPGVARQRGGAVAGPLQFIIWGYLFGMPVLFALHRWLFWKRTRTGIRYLVYAAITVWFFVIAVVLVSGL